MSELAQTRINHEKQAKTATLDLRNCGLSEIPAAVCEMSWLEELWLSHSPFDWKEGEESRNQISDLSGLQNLTRLQFLDLRSNQISDITGLLPLLRSSPLTVEDKSFRLEANPGKCKGRFGGNGKRQLSALR